MPQCVLHEVGDNLVQAFGIGLEAKVARSDLDVEMDVDGVQL